MNIRLMRANKIKIAVAIFVVVMLILHTIKPAIVYNPSGGFRPFGLGYRHKTVIPIWAVSITLAVFSYLAVIYCVTYW